MRVFQHVIKQTGAGKTWNRSLRFAIGSLLLLFTSPQYYVQVESTDIFLLDLILLSAVLHKPAGFQSLHNA